MIIQAKERKMMKKVLLTATVQSHICQFHRPLVEVLHASGYEVHVAAKNNLAEKNGLKLDFVDKIYNIPFSRSPQNSDNFKAYKQLKQLIQREKYDIIHCNTPMGGIITRLAARKARKKGTKVFYTAHGFHFYHGAPRKNWLIYYPIEKIFSRITDKLLTITQEDYELASKAFHCKVYRTHGVGVDEKRYYPISKEKSEKLKRELGYRGPVILNVGELLPNKNQKMAIKMMKKVVEYNPASMLLIAGNGQEKSELEKVIQEEGLENNVQLLGYCLNLQDYQHIANVLAACSYREGLPLNLVEAMLSGTPIVASENRGHRELIEDGITGFLVKKNDTEAMAEKVIWLLEHSEKEDEMVSNALEKGKLYSFTTVKQELSRIYELDNVS